MQVQLLSERARGITANEIGGVIQETVKERVIQRMCCFGYKVLAHGGFALGLAPNFNSVGCKQGAGQNLQRPVAPKPQAPSVPR